MIYHRPILQILQLLAEDDVRHRAITQQQDEPAARFPREHMAQDGDDGGDAGASSQRDIDLTIGQRAGAEATHRRHHVQLSAYGKPGDNRFGKSSIRHTLDGDAQLSVIG